MSILFSSLFASGGDGLVLTMPISVGATNLIHVKVSGFARVMQEANFYTDANGGIENDHTLLGYDVITLTPVSNTSEQTVANISGAGVLTTILTPRLNTGTGSVTVRVTIDGGATIEFEVTLAASYAGVIGFCYQHGAQEVSANYAGIGGGFDSGFNTSNGPQLLIPTPTQAIAIGTSGMKFKTSCVVTVQGSSSLFSNATHSKPAVFFTSYIPEGF